LVVPRSQFGLAGLPSAWLYRNVEELKSKFIALLELVQRTAAGRRKRGVIVPDTIPMRRWKAAGHFQTETGVMVGQSQSEEFAQEDWFRAKFRRHNHPSR